MAVESLNSILLSNMIRLGFGCSGILQGRSRNESLNLLETALDCGVTYFDTARMYGFGGAEGVLGTLVARKRAQLIIASKAGILPASRSFSLRAINRGITLLQKAVPQLKDKIPTPASIYPRVGFFDPLTLHKSVETSLRELRTDYLDIFLLHECTAADVENEELLYFLRSLQKQGKIRAFGIATGIEESIKISNSCPQLSAVLQIPSSIWNMNIRRLPARTSGLTITHSTLTSRFHELTRRISSDDSLWKRWKATMQIDPRDKIALAQLLLAHALQSNSSGIVLFFSGDPKNIRASVKVATMRHISADQIDALNALMKSDEIMLHLEGRHRDHLSVS